MKVHFVLSEDFIFHVIYFTEVARAFPGQVGGVTILYDGKGKGGMLGELRRLIGFFGIWGSFVLGCQRIWVRALDKLGFTFKGYHGSLRSAAKALGIPYAEPDDVNSDDHLAWLSRSAPDLVISSCGQIFRERLLGLPKIACINRHTAPLPRYRGSMPVIHMLARGEKELGVTIHSMELKIDAGRIIAQEEFSVTEDDTLYGVYRKAFKVSIELTCRAIRELGGRPVDSYPVNPVERGSYFGVPTPEEGRALRRNHRVATWGDVWRRF